MKNRRQLLSSYSDMVFVLEPGMIQHCESNCNLDHLAFCTSARSPLSPSEARQVVCPFEGAEWWQAAKVAHRAAMETQLRRALSPARGRCAQRGRPWWRWSTQWDKVTSLNPNAQ